MFNDLTQAGARCLGQARVLLCRGVDWICRQVAQLWAAHRELITSNAGYAAALAAAVTAVLSQTNTRDLIEAIVVGLLSIYVAVQREPIAGLAREFGISRDTAYTYLRSAGSAPPQLQNP
ncbi:MAG: hypothetical protein QOE71_2147 [Pseudonocardiales bacterium]|jgi:hypothetical protein|nr:hypothetical protein [Pseudonocardiales bacterium]